MTPDDMAAIRARADHYGADATWDVRALCDALEQAWAEREALWVDLEETTQRMDEQRERAERAEAYAVLMADKRAEAQLRMRDVVERAERAEAEAEYWKHCYELERDALARVRDLADNCARATSEEIRAVLDGGDQ